MISQTDRQTRYPSVEKRWVKNEKKVKIILEDIQANHNHSWYREILNRNARNMDNIAIYYRGNEITYQELFSASEQFAKSLKTIGITKGDEIIACMTNVPELLYLMMGASCIGAVVNFVSESFEEGCLSENIGKNNKLLVICENYLEQFSKKISTDRFENCLVVSLSDSYKDGNNPYYELEKDFVDFTSVSGKVNIGDDRAYRIKEFMELGMDYSGDFEDTTVDLDTEFTITYTSGSTKVGWPKAIVHTNRSYISIGRFHDPDISRMPAMRNMRGLAHIPTHSNTDLVSSISDPLMQTCTVAFEPIYDKEFFARSLAINKPGFVPATRSFWLTAVKCMKTDKLVKDIDISALINAVAVGEDISKNEENFINECFKEHRAGSKILPRILGSTTISVGGGNCEHGGLFFTLLKGKREIFGNDFGLVPFQLVEMAILKEDGTECDYNELGLLVANSVCTMKEYKNNRQATEMFYKKDAYGRIWGNCNVWATLDKKGRIHIRGRVGNETTLNGKTIPLFKISDVILSNNQVLSCETVNSKAGKLVSFVELLSGNSKELVEEFREQIRKAFDLERLDNYEIRIISEGSFVLTKSGKRNIAYLENLD